MRRNRNGKTPLSAYALRGLIPLGVLCTAVAAAGQGTEPKRDESVVPAPPPKPAPAVGQPAAPLKPTPPATGQPAAPPKPAPASVLPAAPVERTRLEISALRVGAEPYTWGANRQQVRTFVTNSAETLEVNAQAQVVGQPEAGAQIEWEITPPAGFQLPKGDLPTGERLSVRLTRAGGNPTGAGAPLTVGIKARFTRDGKTYEESLSVSQDPRDRLRQEYVDLDRTYLPDRSELLDAADFRARFGRKYRNISFDDLNYSKVPGSQDRYPFILVTEPLVRVISETRRLYPGRLTVSSGFRNPVRQLEVHGSVEESHHQYGRAADLFVAPDSAPPRNGRKIATEADWYQLASTALRAGGIWIEPMLDCHVNTDGCHVHVDVRVSGARSSLVRVSGQVNDPYGNPVGGATVRVAGMPAVTNAQGRYQLKHVLTPGAYTAEVEAPGRGVINQPINVVPETQLTVQVPADPQPTLTARVVVSSVTTDSAGNATVQVALRNVGMSAAQGLGIAVTSAAPNTSVQSITPTTLTNLNAGMENQFQIQVTVPGKSDAAATVPLQITATYKTPTNAARSQTFNVEASVERPASPAFSSLAPGVSAAPSPTKETGQLAPGAGGPNLAAAAGGLLLGAIAALASARLGRRPKSAPGSQVKPAVRVEQPIPVTLPAGAESPAPVEASMPVVPVTPNEPTATEPEMALATPAVVDVPLDAELDEARPAMPAALAAEPRVEFAPDTMPEPAAEPDSPSEPGPAAEKSERPE